MSDVWENQLSLLFFLNFYNLDHIAECGTSGAGHRQREARRVRPILPGEAEHILENRGCFFSLLNKAL